MHEYVGADFEAISTNVPTNDAILKPEAYFESSIQSAVVGLRDATGVQTSPIPRDHGEYHTVYNFEVGSTHTYIAGGVRVHNSSGLTGIDWTNVQDVQSFNASSGTIAYTTKDGARVLRERFDVDGDGSAEYYLKTIDFVDSGVSFQTKAQSFIDEAGNEFFDPSTTEVIYISSAGAVYGGEIGKFFGSALGNLLVGDDANLFKKIVVSTTIGVIAQNVGQAIGGEINVSIVDKSNVNFQGGVGSFLDATTTELSNIGVEFATQLPSELSGAGLSFVSSLLINELAGALGLEGEGAQLFNSALQGTTSELLASTISYGVNGLDLQFATEAVEILGLPNISSFEEVFSNTLGLGDFHNIPNAPTGLDPYSFDAVGGGAVDFAAGLISSFINSRFRQEYEFNNKTIEEVSALIANAASAIPQYGWFLSGAVNILAGFVDHVFFDQDPAAFADTEYVQTTHVNLNTGRIELAGVAVQDGGDYIYARDFGTLFIDTGNALLDSFGGVTTNPAAFDKYFGHFEDLMQYSGSEVLSDVWSVTYQEGSGEDVVDKTSTISVDASSLIMNGREYSAGNEPAAVAISVIDSFNRTKFFGGDLVAQKLLDAIQGGERGGLLEDYARYHQLDQVLRAEQAYGSSGDVDGIAQGATGSLARGSGEIYLARNAAIADLLGYFGIDPSSMRQEVWIPPTTVGTGENATEVPGYWSTVYNPHQEIMAAVEARIDLPGDPFQILRMLSASLQIAGDYRTYLDKTAEINALIAEAPDSPFAVGWVATLQQVLALSLTDDIRYDGRQLGDTVGTEILTADGNDYVDGHGGNDLIRTYGGNDEIIGGSGADEIYAGAGNDIIFLDASDEFIDGGDGQDKLSFHRDFDGVDYNATLFADVHRSIEIIEGTANSDTLRASDQDTTLLGSSGDDALIGGNGADHLVGDRGKNVAFTEALVGTTAFSGTSGFGNLQHDRELADVNGDGRADIIGFGAGQTYVALGQVDGTFGDVINAIDAYSADQGWGAAGYEREVADVNGDGRADIIGFGATNTFTSLGQADGTFAGIQLAYNGFGNANGWGSDDFEREVADVNGDGRADIVGFGSSGTFVALGQSNGQFSEFFTATIEFSRQNGGWDDRHERELGDVNGDGRADIIGFGSSATYVALANDDGTFQASYIASTEFANASGWQSEAHERQIGDVDGDGIDDLVGFGSAGTWIGLTDTLGIISAADLSTSTYASNLGWDAIGNYRDVADVNGDGRADLVGYGSSAVFVSLSLTTDDALFGGAGDDQLEGGDGADSLNGGEGSDTASYEFATSGVRADLVDPQSNQFDLDGGSNEALGDVYDSIENIVGSAHNDFLLGDATANALYGNDGNDRFNGRGGDDALYGGDGSDVLIGANGDDLLQGGVGADTYDGGSGSDTASYSDAALEVRVDLQGLVAGLNDADGDTFTSVENVVGSAHNDHLIGDAEANALFGNDGNDRFNGRGGDDGIYGGEGSDTLIGANGNDTLQGGAGDDQLEGGNNNDLLIGGLGADIFVFDVGGGSDIVQDFQDWFDKIRFVDASITFAGLTFTQLGTDTEIDYGTGTILLQQTTVTEIDEDDFLFA